MFQSFVCYVVNYGPISGEVVKDFLWNVEKKKSKLLNYFYVEPQKSKPEKTHCREVLQVFLTLDLA